MRTMPAKPLTPDQQADAQRLESLFKRWQQMQRDAGLPWSQEVVAERLGFGQSALSQYLKGKIPLNLEALSKFAGLLECTYADISPNLAQKASQIVALTAVGGGENQPSNPPVGGVPAEPQPEYAGTLPFVRRVPVVGAAKLGDNGWYEEVSTVTGAGDGYVEVYTKDKNAYALVVRGDSMHPAIKDGWLVLVEPNSRPTPGEYVLVKLRDGRKMVKELLYERRDSVAVISVNGDKRMTIPREDIEAVQAVGPVIPPSMWRPD